MTLKILAFIGCILVCFVIIHHVIYLHNDFVVNCNRLVDIGNDGRTHKHKELFEDYLRKFNKSYKSDEFRKRLRYFTNNLIKIRKLNEHSIHATYGFNKFSDWSDQEFSEMLSPGVGGGCQNMAATCKRPRQAGNRVHAGRPRFPSRGSIPTKWDWRELHAVTPVLDQKNCPVCWAFSITGVMESMAYIQNYSLTRLSIQNLIDCSFDKVSEKTGCQHGRPVIEAIEFLCRGDGRRTVASEADYPLTMVDEECKNINGIRSLKSYVYDCDMRWNESRLLEAVRRGPVTAVIDGALVRNYGDGVIHTNCEATTDTINHAVQIVGYDRTFYPPYYIVRNSWGDDFGEKGYMRLAIGNNQCGIAYTIGQLEVY